MKLTRSVLVQDMWDDEVTLHVRVRSHIQDIVVDGIEHRSTIAHRAAIELYYGTN